MKELFDTLFGFIVAGAAAYPVATFVLLGLGAVAIAAIARNIVGLAIVGCGVIAGFALSFLLGSVSGVLLALWGALWLVSIAFLLFGRSQSGVPAAGDW
jgi:hypothetical protein